MFWGSNTFWLPIGPVKWTKKWLGNIFPKHKSLIKAAAMTCSLLDVPSKVFYKTATRNSPKDPKCGLSQYIIWNSGWKDWSSDWSHSTISRD